MTFLALALILTCSAVGAVPAGEGGGLGDDGDADSLGLLGGRHAAGDVGDVHAEGDAGVVEDVEGEGVGRGGGGAGNIGPEDDVGAGGAGERKEADNGECSGTVHGHAFLISFART